MPPSLSKSIGMILGIYPKDKSNVCHIVGKCAAFKTAKRRGDDSSVAAAAVVSTLLDLLTRKLEIMVRMVLTSLLLPLG
jgi:predicted alpha/beta hydrolase